MELSPANTRREQIAMALLAKRQEALNVQSRIITGRTPMVCIDIDYLAGRLEPDRPVICFLSLSVFPNRLLTVSEVARHFVSELRAIRPEGPFHLCGYCFGGVIALEMARLLIAEGEKIATLVLMDPPPYPGSKKPFLYRAIRKLRQVLCNPLDGLKYLGFKTKTAQISRPQEIDYSIMDQATLLHPFPPYPGSVTLLVGRDSDRRYVNRARWGRIVKGGIEVRIVSGNHGELFFSKDLVDFFRSTLDT